MDVEKALRKLIFHCIIEKLIRFYHLEANEG